MCLLLPGWVQCRWSVLHATAIQQYWDASQVRWGYQHGPKWSIFLQGGWRAGFTRWWVSVGWGSGYTEPSIPGQGGDVVPAIKRGGCIIHLLNCVWLIQEQKCRDTYWHTNTEVWKHFSVCCCILLIVVAALGPPGYIGCYADDSGDQAFPDTYVHRSSTSQTLDNCFTHCRDNNQRYAGLQWHQTCWCGNDGERFRKHGIAPESSCNSPCTGDSSQICGGAGHNSVYDLGKCVAWARVQCRVGRGRGALYWRCTSCTTRLC